MEPIAAITTTANVGAKAWQAIQFARENVWPWIKEPNKMFDGVFPSRKVRRLERAISEAAAAHPPQDSVRIYVMATPEHKASLSIRGDIRLALHVLGVVPFGVRPFEVSMKVAGFWSGRQVCGCDIQRLSITSDFLGPGHCKQVPVKEKLVWFVGDDESRIIGEAMHVDVAGTLKLHGPWSVEYGDATFSSSLWVAVTV